MARYVSEKMRRAVAERAGYICEYCRLPQTNPLLKHHVEHISSVKHGGETSLENLALACPACNRNKGSDVSAFDPESANYTAFFNPRQDDWAEHFRILETGKIKPLTAEARVTVKILRINDEARIEERRELMEAKIYE